MGKIEKYLGDFDLDEAYPKYTGLNIVLGLINNNQEHDIEPCLLIMHNNGTYYDNTVVAISLEKNPQFVYNTLENDTFLPIQKFIKQNLQILLSYWYGDPNLFDERAMKRGFKK